MDSLAISWLAASATSPLVAVLALWTIYVFHSYRRRWRTVDLFLLTIACQELINAACVFYFAILNLIRHPVLACTSIQFLQVSSRTFQLAALASMVVDRALTVRWPYRYRFSVRRNQIRYHVAVLALVSCLVGVASVFARVQDIEDACRLHPAEWDVRYMVFLLCLYGALVLLWCVCMVQTEVHRSRDGSFQLPECASPDLPTGGMNSPLDTQSSTGSTRALHRPSRQASRRPYPRDNKGTSDLRWPSVAFVSLLCFLLNHLPYLVLMGLAAWNPRLWSPWHEIVISWLGLVEGLLVPLLLFCRDPALKAALRRAFQRRSGALSPLVGDDGPFQMYFDKDHFRKRGTFGSVTPIGIITNYRRTPGSGGCRDSSKNKRRVGKYTLPGLNGDSVLPKSCFLSSGGVGGEPLSKLSCADLTSLEMWREEDEENFYATLSDDFSTFSCKSGDDSALSEDLRISEELYGGSFTTVANDDFEFHDTRPCGGEVRMKPALVSPATPPSRHTSFNKGNIRPKINLPKVFPEESRTTSTHIVNTVQETAEDHKDLNLFIVPPKEWQNDSLAKIGEESDLNSTRTDPSREFIKRQQLPQKPSTSYSMNDLDLIHKNINPPEATSFILPVKSESTMSLYRLNVDQDVDQMMMLTPSKSENNVNGDSGFGSGAQSTNPVWSGFLCRKPSDPFWNMRKPTTNSTTPTRDYPGMLHPRMRKIPWISAWRKLDENSIHNERRRRAKESAMEEDIGWKENLVYESNVPNNPSSGVILEELPDVGSPVCNSDYALDIFAKESGVLMENAYGKIVRDDSGVQVNFYTKGSQQDDVRCTGVIHSSAIIRESNGLDIRNKNEGHPHHHGVSELPPLENTLLSADCTEKMLPLESIFFDRNPLSNDNRQNPEGHYENLFGANGISYANNFALCEPRFEKKEPVQHVWLEKNISRDESFRGTRSIPVFSKEAAYGQLNRLEKLTSNSPKKSPLKSRELRRRESDNRSNRSSNRRRENRNRSDPRPNFILESNAYTSFAQLGNRSEDSAKANSDKNNVEIEMKNVYVRKDFQPESRFEGYGNMDGY